MASIEDNYSKKGTSFRVSGNESVVEEEDLGITKFLDESEASLRVCQTKSIF